MKINLPSGVEMDIISNGNGDTTVNCKADTRTYNSDEEFLKGRYNDMVGILTTLKKLGIIGGDGSDGQTTNANNAIQNQEAAPIHTQKPWKKQNLPVAEKSLHNSKFCDIVTPDNGVTLYLVPKGEAAPPNTSHYATLALNETGDWILTMDEGNKKAKVTSGIISVFYQWTNYKMNSGGKIEEMDNNNKTYSWQIVSMPLADGQTYFGADPKLNKASGDNSTAEPIKDTKKLETPPAPPVAKKPEKKPPTKDKLKGGIWIKAEIGNLYVKVKYLEDGTISDLYLQGNDDRNPDSNNPVDTTKLNKDDLAKAMEYVTKVKNDLYKLQHDTTDAEFNKRLNKIIGNKKAEIDIGIPFNAGADPLHENNINQKTNPYSLDYNPDNTLYGETGGQRTARIGLAHELIGHGGDLEDGTYRPEDKIDPATAIPGVPGSGIPIEEEHAIKWENIERAALGEEQRTTWTSSYSDRPNYSYRVPDEFIVKKKKNSLKKNKKKQ